MSAYAEFTDQLAEHAAAREAVGAAIVALQDGPRRHEADVAAHREHVVATGSGERDPDPDREAELYRAVQESGRAVTWKILNLPDGATEASLVDLRAEARVEAARRRLELSESRLRSTAREQLATILAELAVGPSTRVGAEAQAALNAAIRAAQAWDRVYAQIAEVARWADRTEVLKGSPVNPLAGLIPADVSLGPVPREVMGG